MQQDQFALIVQETITSTAKLLLLKGEEYAGSEDRLANFKRGAALTGATPLQVAFIYASKHYDAIATFIRKDAQAQIQQLSEPIEGRLDDLINYCILMKAIIVEGAQLQPGCEPPAPAPTPFLQPTGWTPEEEARWKAWREDPAGVAP